MCQVCHLLCGIARGREHVDTCTFPVPVLTLHSRGLIEVPSFVGNSCFRDAVLGTSNPVVFDLVLHGQRSVGR